MIDLSFFHYKGGRQNNDKAARLEHKQNDLQTKQKAKYWRKRIVSFSILISWMKIFSVRVLWQSVFPVLVMLCWPRKESLYGKLPFHALSGEGNDYKYELTAMLLYNDKHTPTYAQKREGAICLPKQTWRTDLKTARQHQWLWHRSWLDGGELVRFAPLGKSVLTLTSRYADMNVKILILSKQAYCLVWGEALKTLKHVLCYI